MPEDRSPLASSRLAQRAEYLLAERVSAYAVFRHGFSRSRVSACTLLRDHRETPKKCGFSWFLRLQIAALGALRTSQTGERVMVGRRHVFQVPPSISVSAILMPVPSEPYMRRLVGFSVLATLVVGCSSATPEAAASDSATPPAQASAPIVAGQTISGTVREIIPVESYLYLRLDTANGELWTAVNESKLEVGATVTVYNVLLMEQFVSPTLKRTFARIYFGSLQPIAPAPTGAVASVAGAPSGTPPSDDAKVGVVAPATGSGANTIETLWRRKGPLAGTTVAVRGVVVKYNADVMGKNWIHLQDGSGDPAAGTHDLAATSLEAASAGDTITLMGTLRTNVDVGAGYKYVLLLENARIVGR